MKHLVFFILALSSLSPAVSKEKKLLGRWTFVKTFSREQVGENRYHEKTSGLLNGTIVIEFKADYTATIIGKEGAETTSFDWKLEGRYLALGSLHDHPFLGAFEGQNEIVNLTRHELELVHTGSGRHIFFKR